MPDQKHHAKTPTVYITEISEELAVVKMFTSLPEGYTVECRGVARLQVSTRSGALAVTGAWIWFKLPECVLILTFTLKSRAAPPHQANAGELSDSFGIGF